MLTTVQMSLFLELKCCLQSLENRLKIATKAFERKQSGGTLLTSCVSENDDEGKKNYQNTRTWLSLPQG